MEVMRTEMENIIHQESWFCAMTQFNKTVDGKFLLLVLDYDPDDGSEIQIKFPGGTKNTLRGDRTPEQTLRGEASEELFAGEEGEVILYTPFFRMEIPQTSHVKYFSIVQTKGKFRNSPLRDEGVDEYGNETYEIIGPPRFENVITLAHVMRGSHRRVLSVLLEILSSSKSFESIAGQIGEAREIIKERVDQEWEERNRRRKATDAPA